MRQGNGQKALWPRKQCTCSNFWKQKYHAAFTTLLESLPEDSPRQTLQSDFVDKLHANIESLAQKAMQELKFLDNFEFKYPDGICPFQCVMDSICLLYLWGTTVDNSNDRQILQTFTYMYQSIAVCDTPMGLSQTVAP
jgi:hypothetical protein